jgi:hypothetical protein
VQLGLRNTHTGSVSYLAYTEVNLKSWYPGSSVTLAQQFGVIYPGTPPNGPIQVRVGPLELLWSGMRWLRTLATPSAVADVVQDAYGHRLSRRCCFHRSATLRPARTHGGRAEDRDSGADPGAAAPAPGALTARIRRKVGHGQFVAPLDTGDLGTIPSGKTLAIHVMHGGPDAAKRIAGKLADTKFADPSVSGPGRRKRRGGLLSTLIVPVPPDGSFAANRH